MVPILLVVEEIATHLPTQLVAVEVATVSLVVPTVLVVEEVATQLPTQVVAVEVVTVSLLVSYHLMQVS